MQQLVKHRRELGMAPVGNLRSSIKEAAWQSAQVTMFAIEGSEEKEL